MGNNKNLFFIGFMGCGKSTMARMFSKKTGMELIELDETIEKEEGKYISQIFAEEGEAYFRDLESELIVRIAKKGGMVVSCGGGAILRKENVENMRKNGKIVYFSASPETIFERVRFSNNRPLLHGNMNIEHITNLMEERLPRYMEAADITVSVDAKSKDEILKELIALI